MSQTEKFLRNALRDTLKIMERDDVVRFNEAKAIKLEKLTRCIIHIRQSAVDRTGNESHYDGRCKVWIDVMDRLDTFTTRRAARQYLGEV